MLSSIVFTALFSILSLIFANTALASARLLSGRDSDIEDSYIVKLKEGTNHTNHINSLPFLFSVEDANSPVTHWWPDFFQGYSGIFAGADLDAIRASPDVEYVQKTIIVTGAALQIYGPWNLQAISTRYPVGGTNPFAMIYAYWFNPPIGQGVDIYVIDSGVYIEHVEFEGRASFGWTAPGLPPTDGHGHGTHIAGIAAGRFYGVAKQANIVAVRVLNDDNLGSSNNIISGINWVMTNVQHTRRPSIACVAINSPRDQGMNDAVDLLVDSGVTAVVAAGNYGQDASTTSPASARKAIVVGASDIVNSMWPTSNYGPLVHLFAPGVEITSAGIYGTWSTSTGSGTSEAAAHVAGVAASLLSMNPRMSPIQMFLQIMSLVTRNAINGVPSDTVSKFLYNGVV